MYLIWIIQFHTTVFISSLLFTIFVLTNMNYNKNIVILLINHKNTLEYLDLIDYGLVMWG